MTPQAHPRRRVGFSISFLAWLNVCLHIAGLALAAAFIRPLSPLTPVTERLAFLATSPAGWSIAWAVWSGCALAMVAFAFAVASAIGTKRGRTAAGIALAAAAVDLACDGIYIFHLPGLAADANTSAFLHAESLTNFVSLTVANGLYSFSTLSMTLAIRGRQGIVSATVPVGFAVFGFGMLLAAAGLTRVPEHALWATPPTIGLYCIWVVLMARSLKP